jgi:hypothetical protein
LNLTEKFERAQQVNAIRASLIREWLPVVVGAGIDANLMTPETLFFIAGRVMRDREVERLRMQPEFMVTDPEFPAAFETDWDKLFAAIDCVALRARIGRIL